MGQDFQDFQDLLLFAKQEEYQQLYPKLYDALKGFETLVGLENVKKEIFAKIKSLLVFDLDVFGGNSKPMKKKSVRIQDLNEKKKKEMEKSLRRSTRLKKLKTNLKKKNELEENSEDSERLFIRLIVNQALFSAIEMDAEDENEDENEDEDEKLKNVEEELKSRPHLMLHAMLLGPSGVGKTIMAQHLYNLYEALHLVRSNSFKVVTRADLIAGYVGQTALKIQKLAQEAKDGVIFIDEAYGLINNENDSFGNEALTCIIEIMSNPNKRVTFFFSGYEKTTVLKLFKSNEGLTRRIRFILHFEKPSAKELALLLCNQMKNEQLAYPPDIVLALEQLLDRSRALFNGNYADMILLCDYIKASLAHRLWLKKRKKNQLFEIELKDVAFAIEQMQTMRKNVSENAMSHACLSMYS